MPKVYNMRFGNIPAGAVYVGRPTKWGNPFVVGRDGDRTRVIDLFERYAVEALASDAKRELRGKDLVCWCAPLPCHADVLLKVANAD